MEVIKNIVVEKPWSKGQQIDRMCIGTKSSPAVRQFWGSDQVSAPFAEISKLKPQYRGRFLYSEDYPMIRRRAHQQNVPTGEQWTFFDIENPEGSLTDPPQTKRIVSCAAITQAGEKQVWYLEEDWGNDEPAMIYDIMQYLSLQQIISGWNVRYDIECLRQRYFAITGYLPPDIHCPCVDYMALYRHYVRMAEESFKLGHILKRNGLPGKVEFDGSLRQLYKNKRDLFYEYNLRDVESLYDLDNKLKLFSLVGKIVEISACQWQDAVSNMRIIESLFFDYLWNQGMTFQNRPDRREAIEADEDVEVFVPVPVPGVYRDARCYDCASLYPHVMINWNISAEMYRGQQSTNVGCGLINTGTENVNLTPSNAMFYADEPSLTSDVLKDLIGARQKAKKAGQEIDQWAYKILANSIYGVFGSPFFRLSNTHISDAVRACAADLVKFIAHRAEYIMSGDRYTKFEDRKHVIYGDTDSIYINGAPDGFVEIINEVIIPDYYKQRRLAVDEFKFSVKDEYGKIECMFLDKKKKYIVRRGGELIVKGFERTDVGKMSKILLRMVCDGILDGDIRTKEELDQIAKGVYESMKTKWTDPEWLIPYNINKPRDQYKVKRRCFEGIDLLNQVWKFDGSNTRGVLIELLCKPRKNGHGKMVYDDAVIAIPEDLYSLIPTILKDVFATDRFYSINIIRHADTLLKPIMGFREILEGK